MKTYHARKRLSAQARRAIENTLDRHEEWRTSYWWGDNGNADRRRRRAREFEQSHPAYDIETAQGLVKVRPHMNQSRKITYYRLSVYVGDRRGSIRTLKNLL